MEDISSPCVLISFVFSSFENETHIAGEWKIVFTDKFYPGAKGRGKTRCRVKFACLVSQLATNKNLTK